MLPIMRNHKAQSGYLSTILSISAPDSTPALAQMCLEHNPITSLPCASAVMHPSDVTIVTHDWTNASFELAQAANMTIVNAPFQVTCKGFLTVFMLAAYASSQPAFVKTCVALVILLTHIMAEAQEL